MLCGIGKHKLVSRGMIQSTTRSARLRSTGARNIPMLWACCKIVHARVRWLGRKGVMENEFMLDWCSVYSWRQPSILPFAWKAATLPASRS
jgi:hypothetical protein